MISLKKMLLFQKIPFFRKIMFRICLFQRKKQMPAEMRLPMHLRTEAWYPMHSSAI